MLGDKKVSYSAMQSTGTLTLGNYLGALDNWLKMQEEYECFYAIADLHSLTIRQNPAELEREQEIYMHCTLQQDLILKKTVFIFSHMFLLMLNLHGSLIALRIWAN